VLGDLQPHELFVRVAVEKQRRLVDGEREQRVDVEREERQRARLEQQTMRLLGLGERPVRGHGGRVRGPLGRIRPRVRDREGRGRRDVLEHSEVVVPEGPPGVPARQSHDADDTPARRQRRDRDARRAEPLDEGPALGIDVR
jgi:hypothetical protein